MSRKEVTSQELLLHQLVRIIVLISLCALVACKKETKKKGVLSGGDVVTDLDGTLQPYIDEFKSRLALAGLTPDVSMLTVVFTDSLASNILGSCNMGAQYVRINRALWQTLNSGHREELIFHELGHCVLNRLHDTTEVGGTPVSIMYPYHLGPTIYADATRYADYQTELFGVGPLIFSGFLFDASMYALNGLSADTDYSHHHHTSEEERIFFCPDGENE